jgi:hypothetical protein
LILPTCAGYANCWLKTAVVVEVATLALHGGIPLGISLSYDVKMTCHLASVQRLRREHRALPRDEKCDACCAAVQSISWSHFVRDNGGQGTLHDADSRLHGDFTAYYSRPRHFSPPPGGFAIGSWFINFLFC